MPGEKKASASASACVETALESLQPIRDLAKNWDIDIAACLEEYLQDLLGDLTEEERRNLPKQAGTLNFSQAALVLQNSSSVYSRKVEYLYNLVIQVQEELISSSGTKSRASGKGNSRKSAVDVEIEEFNAFDENVDFLLLDDVLPTGKGNKINLQEGQANEYARDSCLSFASAGTTTRLSLGATLAGSSQLERSGTRQTATHHLIAGSLDAGSLRLIDGRCDVGEDGTLILPGAGGAAEEKIGRSSLFGNLSPRAGGGIGLHDHAAQEPAHFGLGDDHLGDFDHCDNNDNGGLMFADDFEQTDQTLEMNNSIPKDNRKLQSTPKRATYATKPNNSTKGTMMMKQDSWALLDPHSRQSSHARVRPLRLARTYKLPFTVSHLPSQCVTGARTKSVRQGTTKVSLRQRHFRNKGDSFAMAAFKGKLSSQCRQKKSEVLLNEGDVPTLPLKGLAYGDEFLYIARAVAKQKFTLHKELMKKNMENDDDNEVCQQNLETEAEDDGYGVPDFGGGNDVSVDFGHGDDDYDIGFDSMENNNFFSPPNEDGDNAGIIGGQTFEELCRAHIQAFAKGAEAYATVTRLSKRVGDWHERLAPILEEEEARPEFDIHAYTQRVVGAILVHGEAANLDGTAIVDFKLVTENCPRYEVCRLFLASLSLANSRNVKLEQCEEESKFRLKLLNGMIQNPMETYLAPSQC